MTGDHSISEHRYFGALRRRESRDWGSGVKTHCSGPVHRVRSERPLCLGYPLHPGHTSVHGVLLKLQLLADV